MKRKLQVFISSTYKDLLAERQAAVSAVLKAGHIPAGMELFTSGETSQMETIKRWIAESDIYMLILGGRYGSVEKSTGKSYTELEYDYAVSLGMPYFAVVTTEDALDRKVAAEGKEILELENPKLLKDFRGKVLSKMSSFFDDPKDIKLTVHETVADFQQRHQLKGWVPAEEIPDTKGLMSEIERLGASVKALTVEKEELAKQLAKANANKENVGDVVELSRTLAEIKFDVSAVLKTEEIPKEISLFEAFYLWHTTLITGVTNAATANDLETFLFFDLCPKLKVFGLVESEKVSGVRWRRFAVTKLGSQLLAHVELMGVKNKSASTKGPNSEKKNSQ